MFAITCPNGAKHLFFPPNVIATDQLLVLNGYEVDALDADVRLYIYNRYSNAWLEPLFLPYMGGDVLLLKFVNSRTFLVLVNDFVSAGNNRQSQEYKIAFATFSEDLKKVSVGNEIPLLTVHDTYDKIEVHSLTEPFLVTHNNDEQIDVFEISASGPEQIATIPIHHCLETHYADGVFALLVHADPISIELYFYDLRTNELSEAQFINAPGFDFLNDQGANPHFQRNFFEHKLLLWDRFETVSYALDFADAPRVAVAEFAFPAVQEKILPVGMGILPSGEAWVLSMATLDSWWLFSSWLKPPTLGALALRAVHGGLSECAKEALKKSPYTFELHDLVKLLCLEAS